MTDRTEDLDLPRLAARLAAEADLLAQVLDLATEAQWEPGVIVRPEGAEPTGRRSGGVHSDPTADVALDPRRLAVRRQVKRSEDVMRHALVATIGVRRGLEIALARWSAEDGSE